MKVVSAAEMARVERLAYADGASEEEFMERAGRGIAHAVAEWIVRRDILHQVYLLCGKGNNGGDAYVAGRYLLQKGFKVTALQIGSGEETSALSQLNARRLKEQGGKIRSVRSIEDLSLPDEGVILDGLFGTGFSGLVHGLYAEVITHVQRSGLPVVAIDIPSGLDGSTGEASGPVLTAELTVYLGLPKTGFFLQDGWTHVGSLAGVDFGLAAQYIDQAEAELNLVLPNDVRVMKPLIRRTRHKYEAGYVVGLAGSAGMAGAAILSATAAMRSGAGILRLLHPEGMEGELLNCPVEVIRAGYSPRDLDLLAQTMERASACYIGPGVARSPGIKAVLTHILPTLRMPCVIDADGINIMAEEGINPSQHTVLTPHLGEMRRLLGLASTPKLTSSFVSRCAEFATQHEVTLVLKGGPTLVMHPGEVPSVCPRGNPGMATAGSGDVLTGIIAGLLAQGLRQREAAIAGVYLHGVAGDYAAQKLTEYCMMASDICQSLPDAFRECFDLL